MLDFGVHNGDGTPIAGIIATLFVDMLVAVKRKPLATLIAETMATLFADMLVTVKRKPLAKV